MGRALVIALFVALAAAAWRADGGSCERHYDPAECAAQIDKENFREAGDPRAF